MEVGEEREREQQQQQEEVEVQGCTCEHHTESFGTSAVVQKEKGKGKEIPGIALSLAQLPYLEVLRAYLKM